MEMMDSSRGINGLGIDSLLELQTKVREYFTITE